METRVVFPEQALPVKLEFDPELRMSDDDYYNLCMANPDVCIERTAKGEIIIVPPCGAESDYRGADVISQLKVWARHDRRGKAFGSSVAFILPTTAVLSPDAAWVSNDRLSRLTKDQLRKFPPVCPEFVVEVMSPSDRLKSAQEKMREWMRAGVELAWLIEADAQTIYIYRAGQTEPDQRTGISKLSGDGPVAGFELDLTEIWAGL